jgi:hypothetical protein
MRCALAGTHRSVLPLAGNSPLPSFMLSVVYPIWLRRGLADRERCEFWIFSGNAKYSHFWWCAYGPNSKHACFAGESAFNSSAGFADQCNGPVILSERRKRSSH